MVVRPAELTDHQEWLSMRIALWPDCPANQHLSEMHGYGESKGAQMAFVAEMTVVHLDRFCRFYL